jgi:hypothetical protein
MSKLTRVYITALVMCRSLVPSRQGDLPPAFDIPSSQECRPVPVKEISSCLANLSRYVQNDGKLFLFVPGCQAPAAPFVLFRLKREGYSNCTVTATADGLLVEATR